MSVAGMHKPCAPLQQYLCSGAHPSHSIVLLLVLTQSRDSEF